MDALTTTQSTAARQYIVIKLGSEQYGVNINYIDNIVRMQRITRLPADEITDKTRIIIIKLEQQATVGLIVDQVNEVVTLDEDSIEKTTVDANKDMAGYISAIGKNKGELISLLNIQLAITDKDTSKED